MNTKRPTLADVARLSGFSRTTVSLVLNNRPNTRLSEEAADRVRSAAAELNYRPNPAARGLRMGKTRTVAFVSCEVTITRFASAMVRGLLDVAEERDHLVTIAESGPHPDQIARALEAVLDRRADGIVYGMMGAKQMDLPDLPPEVPVVVANGSATAGFPSVIPDEYHGGYEAARYLLDRGHRRIGFIGRSPELLDPAISLTIGDRYAGIDAAFAEAGVALACQVPGAVWEPDLGYTGAQAILDRTDVTAIIAANDRVAMGIYQAAQERGISIPEQLSIVSFDDEALASYVRPQLTTVRIPYREIGRIAMNLVLDGSAPDRTLVAMPLQERASVRDLRP